MAHMMLYITALKSLETLTQVRGEDGRVRVDACVNGANTLAAWAEVEQDLGELDQASRLLVSAVEGYRRALEQEEDAAVRLLSLHLIPFLQDFFCFILAKRHNAIPLACHKSLTKLMSCGQIWNISLACMLIKDIFTDLQSA